MIKGADTCDTVVRDETSFFLHVGRDLEPGVLFRGTSGVDGMGYSSECSEGRTRGVEGRRGRMEPKFSVDGNGREPDRLTDHCTREMFNKVIVPKVEDQAKSKLLE